MKKSLILLTFSAGVLSGCASTGKNPTFPIENVSVPALNADSMRTLGESLLMQGYGYYTTTLTISPLEAYTTNFLGGTFYNIPGTEKYVSDELDTVHIKGGFGDIIGTQAHVYFNPSDNRVCTTTSVMTGNCFDRSKLSFEYNDEKTFKTKANSFQQEIIYNGKSGNELKFTYREYSDSRIRDSFSADFSIDLTEGNTIGYKGAVIEVIKATNSSIQYKVKKNFTGKGIAG